MGAKKTRKKENWGSQIGVILAVSGCAVGLGNFLRFPGQAAMHGGGAFMIPYFIAILVLAIPLSWSEWALGRAGGRQGYNSAAGIYHAAGKRRIWTLVGALGAVVPLGVCMYYTYVQAWCLAYAIQYFVGILHTFGIHVPSFLAVEGSGLALGSPEAYAQFFNGLIGVAQDGSVFASGWCTPLMGCLVFCFLLNYFLIYRGISKGIEMFCRYAMPMLLVCSIIILIRVLTLGNPTGTPGQGFLDGLGFMWNPSRPGLSVWDSLKNPDVWLAATSQIFFSVSIGFGLIVTYASYVRKKDDIALSALTATSGNEFCEVAIAGMMIIPATIMFLGFGAVTPDRLGSSFSMGFIVLPNVFEQMLGGQIFGFLFFFLLFLAAVTSAISMPQPSVALLEEAFHFSRKTSVLTTATISGIGTFLVCYFSQRAMVLDTFDFWFGSLGVFILATLQTILVAWVWGTDKMMAELDQGAKIRVPRAVGWVLKYVSTPYLVIIFVVWCWNNLWGRVMDVLKNHVLQCALAFALVVLLGFGVMVWCYEKRLTRAVVRPSPEDGQEREDA